MSTIWLEFTRRFWFPPQVDLTLFGPVYRFGWVGLGFSRHNLTGWINAWRTALERAKAADRKSGGKRQQK